jgi:2-aminobenzoate-CoA ligase
MRADPAADRSAFVDTFALDHQPRPELRAHIDLTALPHLAGRGHLNAAAELLDAQVARGHESRTAIRTPSADWTYGQLLDESNRIAHALVDDFGLIPGHRVLLRGPNHPMMAAAWFAVLKAGGVAVTTMPLLRSRELAFICNKAR